MKESIINLFTHLHEHAEVSWKEIETTNYLVALFEEAGFQPQRFQHIPGFSVEIGEGSPKIGLRADMDALWQEVNGEMRANHSCGHDAHMTIVTGVMQQLQKIGHLNGTVRAIFQPAEELGNGSLSVIQEGVIDDLDYLYGVHVRPFDEISYPNCAAGIQHGACLFVKGQIDGLDHHGARPHKGINAIEVVTSIVQQLSFTHIDPHIAATVKMTNVHAGTENFNIIPGKASFGLDLRAQTNEVMEQLKAKVENVCQQLSALYHVPIHIEFFDHVPAAVVNEEAAHFMAQAIEHILERPAIPIIITPGADDFHFYTIERPHLKATMLGLGADVTPGLHDPYMQFNHQSMEKGIAILTDVCLRTIKQFHMKEGED
ncbi:amidohydrolase [Lysinibacillus piscis]|uniref:Amidohydrolase AmhX n=1 Tax=Lysinibacillus piscis TaxID=2518931 RepID=A0ABQ5NNR0_9BACI|nr:amidohydrolase [Lysinibacillus sp. KH24]GLC89748.1 amidohydrolase AmhX [Lysinibacillus sp. KH24]